MTFGDIALTTDASYCVCFTEFVKQPVSGRSDSRVASAENWEIQAAHAFFHATKERVLLDSEAGEGKGVYRKGKTRLLTEMSNLVLKCSSLSLL